MFSERKAFIEATFVRTCLCTLRRYFLKKYENTRIIGTITSSIKVSLKFSKNIVTKTKIIVTTFLSRLIRTLVYMLNKTLTSLVALVTKVPVGIILSCACDRFWICAKTSSRILYIIL